MLSRRTRDALASAMARDRPVPNPTGAEALQRRSESERSTRTAAATARRRPARRSSRRSATAAASRAGSRRRSQPGRRRRRVAVSPAECRRWTNNITTRGTITGPGGVALADAARADHRAIHRLRSSSDHRRRDQPDPRRPSWSRRVRTSSSGSPVEVRGPSDRRIILGRGDLARHQRRVLHLPVDAHGWRRRSGSGCSSSLCVMQTTGGTDHPAAGDHSLAVPRRCRGAVDFAYVLPVIGFLVSACCARLLHLPARDARHRVRHGRASTTSRPRRWSPSSPPSSNSSSAQQDPVRPGRGLSYARTAHVATDGCPRDIHSDGGFVDGSSAPVPKSVDKRVDGRQARP